MMRPLFVAVLLLAAPSACKAPDSASRTAAATIPLTIESGGKRHAFRVEVARTPAQQQRGLMFRPPLADDAGMLFFPYPADGGPPREASFWMKDTPSPLDIVFIRPDRTIATIGADTIPLSEVPVTSGEPVAAVLELRAGRAAELGLQEGDTVDW